LEDIARAARERRARQSQLSDGIPPEPPIHVHPVPVIPAPPMIPPGYAPPHAVDPRNEFVIGHQREMGRMWARGKILLIILACTLGPLVLFFLFCIGSVLIGASKVQPPKQPTPTPYRTAPAPPRR
jgi:hypothetical protein